MRMLRANFFKRTRDKRGFTLIELLVVISIISLLSSVILASLNGARDKAKIAAGKQFAHSLHNAIGLDLVGEWKFEQEGDLISYDTSGYGNSGGLSGGATQVDRSFCGLGLGGCLQADGISGYVDTADALDGEAEFTMSFWVQTTESGTHGTFWRRPAMIGKSNGGSNSGDLGIVTNNGYIGFWSGISNPDASYLSTTKQINDNQWHHIALTCNGTTMELFVDTVSQSTLDCGDIALNNEAFWIGGKGGSELPGSYHEGKYDEVRFYASALTAKEVGKIYAEGRVTHPLAEAL
jgi:prepilin-type N-terminal cleavage/methylation domain-containing protein